MIPDITSKIEIFPMEVKDIEDVLEIERQSFPNPWSYYAFYSEITSNVNAYYITAKYDKKIIGYAGIWIIIDEGHISNIAVHPNYRRQGIGGILLTHLIEYSKQKGVKLITLDVREKNLPAQQLYKKYGFEVISIRKNYYSDTGESSIVCGLTIT